MGFDKTWEEIFRSRAWGHYPSEDVVRFVARHFFDVPDRRRIRILDLGCGGGAHTWFLAREGFTATAVDGSQSAVAQTRALLAREQCTADVSVRDFLNLGFADASFDAVLDSASVQHNPWDDIVAIHSQILRMLRPGGWFFGTMLHQCAIESEGARLVTGGDVSSFRAGSIEHDVFVHMFSRAEVLKLLSGYGTISIDTLDRTDGGGASRLTHFLVAAQKRSS